MNIQKLQFTFLCQFFKMRNNILFEIFLNDHISMFLLLIPCMYDFYFSTKSIIDALGICPSKCIFLLMPCIYFNLYTYTFNMQHQCNTINVILMVIVAVSITSYTWHSY